MGKYVVALMMFVVSFAAWGIAFQNQSNTVLRKSDTLKCGNGLSCANTSGKIEITVQGDGADPFVGFIQSQVASTTTTLTIAQCGSSIISNSADVVTLPEASTALGCRYTFTCGTADDFDVNPNDGTDQILSVSTTNGTTGVVTLAPSAGDAIRCTDIGGSITLEAIGANAWAQVAGGNGIWTDVN